ncbi:hypothetical protein AB0G60_02890 [Streptomyces angustmyceticus]|uniref:Uncharacterized protein n=1 Tax=Streptomyces angustmyceticus TaxID=285578 RepID=A0A5J4L8R3_9ACTN|nr:hypothetical protein [Streptomyces angustmyceticus]UAL65608.1 hypothetical protein K7396_02855 [Streptomyces angustmyceticus]GES27870.1 hypothetical protein San01_03570 [Streptomyces angustmyceticus]
MTAPCPEPALPRCATCGDERGPWRPTGERYPSGTQVLTCSNGCKARPDAPYWTPEKEK